MADLENARYINLALKQIEQNVEWLRTTNKPVQAVLTHIDILVMLANKFPVNANLLIRKHKVQEWKTVFNEVVSTVVATKFLRNIEMELKQMPMNYLHNWNNMDTKC